jgi:hypothetical protein
MNSGLEQRRAYLLAKCTREREQLCTAVSDIEEQLEGVQRVSALQRLVTLPGLLVSGSLLAMVVITGRVRALRLISAGLALWATVRRFRQGRLQFAELVQRSDF